MSVSRAVLFSRRKRAAKRWPFINTQREFRFSAKRGENSAKPTKRQRNAEDCNAQYALIVIEPLTRE